MSQEGIDKLTTLTDSRYRLSIIVAERAAQLKAGYQSVLDRSVVRINWDNAVTVAMKELELHPELFEWGPNVPKLEVDRRPDPKGGRGPESAIFGND